MKRKERENELVLIPKYQTYMQYTIEMLIKIPRTEKFSIGTEYKQNMYKTIQDILMLSKIGEINKIQLINKIDANINVQRIFLRILVKNRWISQKQFDIEMNLLYEIGKIVGGLLKYYGKNNTKSI